MLRKMVMAVLVVSIIPALMGTAYSGLDISSISDNNAHDPVVVSGVHSTGDASTTEHAVSGTGDGSHSVSEPQAIRRRLGEKTKKPKRPTGFRIIR